MIPEMKNEHWVTGGFALVTTNRPQWELSDALMRKYNTENDDFTGNYHFHWSRYVKWGTSTYRYELHCTVNVAASGGVEPDGAEKWRLGSEMNKFAVDFMATHPDGEPEEATGEYQRTKPGQSPLVFTK